jgi:nitrile hydratase
MTERVRIRDWRPFGGHVRTPWYLRGKAGVIERDLGETLNAEALAYNRYDDKKRLVRVRFTMAEIWGDAAERPGDTLDAEIFEHWLEPAEPDHAP